MTSRPVEGNVASSSGSNVRSSLIGMGFKPSHVDKVIEEKGGNDIDSLLEALFAYPALQESHPDSSDSLDSLFGNNNNDDASSPPEISTHIDKKEEGDLNKVNDEKRATLLSMNFSPNEIDFAIDKLGNDAPTHEVVDFIFAAQMAENYDKEQESRHRGNVETNEIMNKRGCLLEMGFSENEISTAIDKFGLEIPISELADSIFAGQIADSCIRKDKYSSTTSNLSCIDSGADHNYPSARVENGLKHHFSDAVIVKKEEYSPDAGFWIENNGRKGDLKGKSLKEEYVYFDTSSSSMEPTRFVKRKLDPEITSRRDRYGMPPLLKSNTCRSLDKTVAEPPYFFYGNVVKISEQSWAKVSQFLYAVHPEFVDARMFSSLSREEGYIHNLPTENRVRISPKSPMTIEDAIPQARKWWPSWDTRKLLSRISSEVNEISHVCDKLEKKLISSHGLLSHEQQNDILHQCSMLNLVWVGRNRLGPIEPEHLECILGYPLHHTQTADWSMRERLEALKNCFQTDTLGYHLSGMKSTHPGGISVLSIFSGIGGAEVALHRLGIHLKGIVSVENNKTKQMILKRWWHATNQTGELVQLEDIQKLTTSKLESLMVKFGGFDFVVCQNPCTYSLKGSKLAAHGDTLAGFDFSLFYEFVRVLQRVKSMMRKKR